MQNPPSTPSHGVKRQRPVGTIYRACGASLRGCHQTLGGQGWLMEEIRKRSWDFGNGNQPKTQQELVVSSISSAELFWGKMGSRLMSIFSNWRIMECHKCVVATSKPFKQTCNIGKHKNSTMNCICIFPFSRNGFAGQYYLLEFTYFLFWLCQWRSQ